jgi:hypothetical protein
LGFQEALTASGNKIIQQYVEEKRCNLGTAREKYSHLFFYSLPQYCPQSKDLDL